MDRQSLIESAKCATGKRIVQTIELNCPSVHRSVQEPRALGEAAGTLGTPTAQKEDPGALHQPREMGGNAGGGRPKNGGVPWNPKSGELHFGCHEHCECLRGGKQSQLECSHFTVAVCEI